MLLESRGFHAQLRQNLIDLPCEKRVSLEILKIQKCKSPKSFTDIFNHLPDYCKVRRVRCVIELQEFCFLYPEFHHDLQELKSYKTNAEEDFITMAPADCIGVGEGIIDI